MKILILGLGNPILRDDGVGVKIAATVVATLQERSQAEAIALETTPLFETFQWPARTGAGHITLDVAEASVGGLRLMETLVDYDRAIIVDAMLHPDVPPGTFRRMTLEDLAGFSPTPAPDTQHSASAHDTSLAVALEMGRRMGFNLPSEIVLYAVGAEEVLVFSETLTDQVAPVVTEVVEAILKDLECLRNCETMETVV